MFVITGPSGVGKGTLIRALLERVANLELSVSATTRSPRPGEENGTAYHFLERDEFERRVADGDFVEWAEYSGNRYGTLRSELERRVDQGVPVVLEIEVQEPGRCGRRCPRRCRSSSLRHRARRFAAASRDAAPITPEQVTRRLQTADAELAAQPEFQHVVVNGQLDDAIAELVSVINAELTAA